MTNTNSKAKLKLKELREFKSVVCKAEEQFCWADDFTHFPQIKEWCSEILNQLDDIQHKIDREIDYVDSLLEDYDYELTIFEKENEVRVD
jgi:hypothetical protein